MLRESVRHHMQRKTQGKGEGQKKKKFNILKAHRGNEENYKKEQEAGESERGEKNEGTRFLCYFFLV